MLSIPELEREYAFYVIGTKEDLKQMYYLKLEKLLKLQTQFF